MNISNKWAPILVVLFILSSSCNRSLPQPTAAVTKFSENKMTIDYHIIIGDPINNFHKQLIQKIIDQTFEEIDLTYNKWNPLSEVSQINSLKARIAHPLSEKLTIFLKKIGEMVDLSEGRFDPTIEPLQKLWIEKLNKGEVPDLSEIEEIKPCIGWGTLVIQNGFLTKKDERTQLDFGGVAKGLCVDLLIERLYQAGFHNLYVEWGGEIKTAGYHPAGRPWHIYVSRLSNPDPAQALIHLDLINQALATSGDYFQSWTIIDIRGEEKTYCHIVNPLTLSLIQVKKGSVASATLLAPDCLKADALAKVLMLFDSTKEAQDWVKKLQVDEPSLACWIFTRE